MTLREASKNHLNYRNKVNVQYMTTEADHSLQAGWKAGADSYKIDIICICEVIDISPGNLDSSLCFLQPRVSHDATCLLLLLLLLSRFSHVRLCVTP